MASDSYDLIIIGGGTAGLVLAARLSENPGLEVLVVEAGVDQKDDPRVTTPALWSTLIKSSSDWTFDTVPQTPLGNRRLPFPHGKALGGTSAINGLVFTPVPKSNVDGWAALGNPGWEWSAFSQSFRKAFTLTPNGTGPVCGSGPLQVSYPDQNDSIWPSIWKETLAGLGFSVSGDLFTGQANGLIINPESIEPATKKRSFAQSAFLAPAMNRDNLTVLTGVMVDKILLSKPADGEDALAEGIQYTKGDETKVAYARKEVILAAGVINSPCLLERSGIGSAEVLHAAGIDVVVENPNVGENLQNHIIVTVSSEVNDGLETMDGLRRQDPEVIAAATEAYAKQAGPFTTTGTSVAAQLPFPGIQTEEGKQDLERILATTLEADSGVGTRNKPFEEAHKRFVQTILSSPDDASGYYITFPGWAAFNPDGSLASPPEGANNYFSVALLSTHPLSRGSTHITSSPTASPDGVGIDPGYLRHPLDVEVFARNLRQLEKILASEPLASQLKRGGKRNASAPAVGGFEDLEAGRNYVKDNGLGGNHFVGSCSMMPREMGGVVDSKLRVYGTKNLRVCDASIIPLIPRGNTQAAVYGVAEHGASIIQSTL